MSAVFTRRLNWRANVPLMWRCLTLACPTARGFSTFKKIKEECPQLPIVVLTSVEDEVIGMEAIRNGAQDYLTKGSVDGKTIARTIRYAIERKQMEEALRVKIAELAYANNELDAFSYSVSHDLRSPLQGIIGLCEILAAEYGPKLDANAREMMSDVVQSAHRISDITLDLLSLSKISLQEIKRQNVNLSEISTMVIDALKKSHSKRNIEIRIEPGLCASADPGLARILLENLFGNAWKFTLNRESPRIEFGVNKANGTVEYFIRDNGAGFDMALADKIFKPFQRLHSNQEYKGTGIGLSIVKRIIERHCGTIRVEGEIDKGATFYFRFE